MIDVQQLLEQISPDAPCGENLEYEPAFVELERAARGTPEQQIGNIVTAAEEPIWREVQKQAIALLRRAKDLRFAIYLTQALVFTEGLRGLREGLALVRGLVERYWEPLHPQLDPEDDRDPTQRINILMSLCDPYTVLKGVRQAPLTTSRALGRYSLRDIHLATGRLTPPADSDLAVPKMETIHAAFADSELGDLQTLADVLQASRDDLSAIEACVAGQVGADRGPNLSPLAGLLKETQQVVNEQLARLGPNREAVEVTQIGPTTSAGVPKVVPPRSGEIVSREDVARFLDAACEYFERNEPSSPVPLLLKRARRLISKDFMEIMRDLAPAGIEQAELISGRQKEE